MSADIPMISLVKKGTKEFPRFVLSKADEFRNPTYWTGSGWDADESSAVVFASANDAAWVYQDILMDAVGDRPCHRFVAPLYIEIYGVKPKLADLRRWLDKAVRIVVDVPKHGLGPNDTVGVLIADFEETRSV